MIRLTNVNIKYDRVILEEGEISIPAGAVTAITGESGSGKTSVLYHLGLLTSDRDYQYEYDGRRIELADDAAANTFRREKFGFLFQDNSLIETITVAENIRYIARLSGRDISDEMIGQLMEMVDLHINPAEAYPRQLSGGEQQRAALAAILAKQPEYIFADEPTSALDRTNEGIILAIFKKMAEQGIGVVLATHNPNVCEIADNLYRIEGRKILAERQTEKQEAVKKQEAPTEEKYRYGTRDLRHYSRAGQKKNKGLRRLITVLCAIAITGFSLTSSILNTLGSQQAALLNQISDREIFLVNQAYPEDSIRDHDGNLVLSDADLADIGAIDGVDEVFPFFEWRSFCLVPDHLKTGTSVSVRTDKGITQQTFSLDSSEYPYFIMLPYNENQTYEKNCVRTFTVDGEAGGGFYLSHDMAEMLGLLEPLGSTAEYAELTFEIGIPFGKIDTAEEADGAEYRTEMDVVTFREVHIPVSGIIDDSVVNRYSINGNQIIYAPVDYMLSEIEEAKQSAAAEDWSDIEAAYGIHAWGPSACFVYTENYNGMNVIQGKLERLNPQYATRYDWQDTESMEKMIAGIESTARIVLGIVLGILFVLMAAVFISTTLSRKREIAILKANGMTNRELTKLMVIESLQESLKIFGIAIVIAVVLSAVGSQLLLAQLVIFDLKTVLYIAAATLLFVLIPTVVSVWLTLRVQPEQILRN